MTIFSEMSGVHSIWLKLAEMSFRNTETLSPSFYWWICPATRGSRVGRKMFFNNPQWGFKIRIKAPFSFFKYCFSRLLALPIGTKPDITALKWIADKKTQNKSVKVLCWWSCVSAPAWVQEVTVANIFSLKSIYLDLQHDIFEIEAQRDHFY